MKIFKKFYFKLPIVYLFIIILALIGGMLIGGADLGYLFYPGWVILFNFFKTIGHDPYNLVTFFGSIVINFIFYFLIGLFIDKIIHKFKKNNA